MLMMELILQIPLKKNIYQHIFYVDDGINSSNEIEYAADILSIRTNKIKN